MYQVCAHGTSTDEQLAAVMAFTRVYCGNGGLEVCELPGDRNQAAQLTRRELEAAVAQLVDANRARCLWFAAREYQPATDEARLRALRHIEQHGDRKAYVRSRELRDWLLQTSSEK